MTGLHDIPEEKIFHLAEKLDTRGPRYTSYPTVPVWQEGLPIDLYLKALERVGAEGDPYAIYVHLPFCRSRCLYCGCNSCITQNAGRMGRYMAALTTEVECVSRLLSSHARHRHLHLGGGTPTYTPIELLEAFLIHLLQRMPGAAEADLSVEVDPRVTSKGYLVLLAKLGFTRISIGLQDFNYSVQQAVKRVFSYEQMAAFIAAARDTGFTSVNLDLIYGLPLQTRKTWTATLEAVLSLKPDRIACFGYAHLPEKIIHQRAIYEKDLPSPRVRLGMLLDANRFFTEAGYEAIGMDHFALPEDELAQARREGRLWRNFMGYTTIRGMELLGLGCSSISEFPELFTQNLTPPEKYGSTILEGQWAVYKGHALFPEDVIRKQIINQLMCNLEIGIPSTAQDLSSELSDSLKTALESLRPYVEEGLIIARNGGYSVTPLGQLFLRNLAMPFDGYLGDQLGVTYSRTV